MSQGGRHEDNLANQGDVVTEPVQPGVAVTHGQIDVDPGKEIVNRPVGQDIRPTPEMMGSPRIYGEAGVYRLTPVEDRTKRRERSAGLARCARPASA